VSSGRGPDPSANLLPGSGPGCSILFSQKAADDVELDTAAGECAGNFRDTAGAAIGQPFTSIGLLIVKGPYRLKVKNQDGTSKALYRRYNLRRGGVRADVTDYQVDIFTGEETPRLLCGRLIID
jgi:hypothetical protein